MQIEFVEIWKAVNFFIVTKHDINCSDQSFASLSHLFFLYNYGIVAYVVNMCVLFFEKKYVNSGISTMGNQN